MEQQTFMFIAGGGCLLVAFLIYRFGYRPCARRYDTIRAVPTIAARDVPGLGAAMVEVTGLARCPAPLISDLARVPCVAFTCCVTEHWTTTRTERDSKGNTRRVTEHHSATRYANEQRIAFEVRDESGGVLVRPEGAAIDLLDAMGDLDGPRPDSPAYGLTPQHFGGSLRYSESVLPVGQRLYVLGQVGADHAIQRPAGFDRPFVISFRGEAELCRRARIGKWAAGLAGLAFLAGGFGLFAVADRMTAPAPMPAPVKWNVGAGK
ncbi:MAG: hypothetical protein HRF43_02425 [Phycisphaerae bacterium]|jgi:hypothetical protein